MATYANRTDLQNPTKKLAVTAATGQTYGEAGAQRAAQQAVPMGTPQAPQAPSVTPGSLGALDRPTERPLEPVTAGNPLGAGPGAEALVTPLPDTLMPGGKQDLVNQVRYVYSKYPNTALLQLLFELENQPIQ
jgi:hypothetical protein